MPVMWLLLWQSCLQKIYSSGPGSILFNFVGSLTNHHSSSKNIGNTTKKYIGIFNPKLKIPQPVLPQEYTMAEMISIKGSFLA